MEAEHAIDDRNAFDLYNCLIPKLKEHRRFRVDKNEVFSIADFNATLEVRRLEAELARLQVPELVKKNTHLTMKVEQLEEELKIVQFYL